MVSRGNIIWYVGEKAPFNADKITELKDLIIKGEYKPLDNISPEARDLIKNMLEINPKKRISIEDILAHPWLINVDLKFWKSQNLFTNAEYIFFVKNNVDYRDINNKDDMIEIFDIKNLDTDDEDENENPNSKTKSIIYTPYNSYIEDDNNNLNDSDDSIDLNNKDIEIQNYIIEYSSKVKDLNRKYEMNNNEEIDNGFIDEDKYNQENNISPSNGNFNNNENINIEFNIKNEAEEIKLNMNNNKEIEINEKALEDLEKLGFDKTYVKECLIKNDFNYATTSYGLLVKYCYS